ncbi:hypothetical protein MARA_15750 [Mycolicibacterium arabiense]|uniref:CsbD family protein n=1 Tax=Mycolicibacterium arabiense TaxID=1286181 RepID=A0A7I7RU71_9MYCO|nr:CsbD family protein [Mycolicibacterium arabiense]BBY48107.1 hypothetical protein MARA_15750 [Mycolicibacterium arabiense]
MADFADKAQEVAGRAKRTAGDLTGNDDLKAEGAADQAQAKVAQGIDAAADKAAEVKEAVSEAGDVAQDKISHLAHDTADAARQLHLDDAASVARDNRVIIAAIVAAAVAVVLLTRRALTR